MAGSRLPNFGTIFSRMTGLLETGAVKEVPLWYNVYKKYPPPLEPRSDRPLPPQDPIPEIVYEEDYERANKPLMNNTDLSSSDSTINKSEKDVLDLLEHANSIP